ncbi:DUF3127 domain-containing protein [Chryseobacterium defluvii]|uniref:Uncharacterized protein DUF3127 n=1 Tax=Chryseobacterium defluvii TaxID=160396 RepID=A0A495SMW4_9FLAO|nr:DUF3127 domain-containing protein [Chryseobacterium defluvii]RKT01055.1 uncharacterized protein DUF3127 [Chryseobacterium defluvii]
MELQGTVKFIGAIQTYQSGFQKREIVILTEEQYPQPISIEFLSDKISLLDNVQSGESVKIGINIRGREWTNPQGETKYFNSINGWRLEKVNKAGSQPQNTQTNSAPVYNNENPFAGDDDDDLPF